MLEGAQGKPLDIINIATLTTKCIRLLAEADSNRKRRSLSERTQTALDDLQYLFRVWVGNVGVFAPGPGSTDNRLQDDKEIADAVMFALARLGNYINDIVHPILLEIPESEDELTECTTTASITTEPVNLSQSDRDREEQPSASDSESSESSLSPEPSSDEDSDGGKATTPARIDGDGMIRETQQIVGAVDILIQKANKMVDRLYKLASVLRKPISASEDTRVQAFLRKHGNDKDVVELLDHDALKNSATFQIGIRNSHKRNNDSLLKPIPEELVNRLVESILLRRSKLIYRQRHQEKLRAGASDAFRQFNETQQSDRPVNLHHTDEGLTTGIKADSEGQQPGNPPELRNLQPLAGDPQHRFNLFKAAPSAMYSATLASSVDRGRFAGANAKSVVMSRISPSTAERQLSLGVRAPPLSEGTGMTECPLCFKLISNKEVEDPKYWTRHLLKDIQPYVCLFKNCRSPRTMYSVPEDWLRHLQSHTSVWCCEVPGHEQEVFDRPDDLKEHLKELHSGFFTQKQLLVLVERGERSVDDPFIQLGFEYDNSYSFETEQRHICPLCWEFSEPFELDGHQDDHPSRNGRTQPVQNIYQHILAHLENWALLSLPDSVNIDDFQSGLLRDSQKSVARSRTTLASFKRTHPPGQGWEDNIDDSTLIGQTSAEEIVDWSNPSEDRLIGVEPPELASEEPWDFYYNDQNTQMRVPDPDEDSLLLRWSARMERDPNQAQSKNVAKQLEEICSWLCPRPTRSWHSFPIPQAATQALSKSFDPGYWFYSHPNFLYWFHSTAKRGYKTTTTSEDSESSILICYGRKTHLRMTNNAMVCRYLETPTITGIQEVAAGLPTRVAIIPVYLDFGPSATSNEDALEVVIRYILKELIRSLHKIPSTLLEASQNLTNDDSGMDGRWGLSAVTDLAISIFGEFGCVFICVDSQLDDFNQLDTNSILEWAADICERCSNVRFLIHLDSEIYNTFSQHRDISFSSIRHMHSFSDFNMDWCYQQWFLASHEGDLNHKPPFRWYDVLEEAISSLLKEYESWGNRGPNNELMRLHYKEIASSRYDIQRYLEETPANTLTEALYLSVLMKLCQGQEQKNSDQAFLLLSLVGLSCDKTASKLEYPGRQVRADCILELYRLDAQAKVGRIWNDSVDFSTETEQTSGREYASLLLAAIQSSLGLLIADEPREDKIGLAEDNIRVVHPSLFAVLHNIVYESNALGSKEVLSPYHELYLCFENAQRYTMELFLRYLTQSSGLNLWNLLERSKGEQRVKGPSSRDLRVVRKYHPAITYVAWQWVTRLDYCFATMEAMSLSNIYDLLEELIIQTRKAIKAPLYLAVCLCTGFGTSYSHKDDPIKPPPWSDCTNPEYDPKFTLTHIAASFCSVRLMDFLNVRELVEPFQRDTAGMTPLLYAIARLGVEEQGDTSIYSMVSWMLKRAPNLPGNIYKSPFTRQRGLVALRFAFNRNMLVVMDALLEVCTVEVLQEDEKFRGQVFEIFEVVAHEVRQQLSSKNRRLEDSKKVLLLFILKLPSFTEIWKEYNLRHPRGSKFHIAEDFPSEEVVKALVNHGLLGPRMSPLADDAVEPSTRTSTSTES